MNLIKEKKWTFGLDGFFGNEKFLLMEIKMLFLNEFIKKLLALHELQNYMLRIIRVWSSVFAILVYLKLMILYLLF